MKLETKRLVLRPLVLADAKSIVENANNLNISKYLAVVPYPYKMKDAREWLKSDKKKSLKRKKEGYSFGIELKEEKKIIGGMGLHRIKTDSKSCGVGYWIGAKYHGNGYGSEALKSLIDFAFGKLKLNRLEADVFVGNKPSAGLLEKFGFVLEGKNREAHYCKATGKIHDTWTYGLLKKDYLRRRN